MFVLKFFDKDLIAKTMVAKDFNDTIDVWIEGLNRYSFNELIAKPIPGRWSLGQIYMHVMQESGFFFTQIVICASNDENAEERMNSDAREMFLNNGFPDQEIEGPPSNALVRQPESKEYLVNAFAELRNRIGEMAQLISMSQFNGKTRHPGLGFFSADDWFQFTEMHCRHHLRQKARIEKALAEGRNHLQA
ncbi:DinB family protein [Dyadobacter pollutisoli]|uniref:DinB family protein n=2 Tax=Dyadobacter pollutisoli TaxID=2910158 RepID=A0A9E8SN00_9BACT|nr:DinB family protein [Dyadobacter pollutisoli]WAC15330.1 DinB family protein [Dyadobacter pollutisoli]